MRNEITAAVLFLVQLIEKNEKFSPDQLDCFRRRLIELLTERFENHWFPDKPFKGQGYRCIRVNGNSRRDATLESAASAAGFKYEDLSLPVELTLWVDPHEVCCRFGENKGSYCTLASFDNNSANHLHDIDGSEKENKFFQRSNQKNISNVGTDQVKPKPLSSSNQNHQQSINSTNNNNTSTTTSSTTSTNANNNNNNNNGPGRRRHLINSPRPHLSRNRSWFNHSFNMGYGPHPMSQPWYNVMPPHTFLGGPSPPPFVGHRGNKWIAHPPSYSAGPTRFHHWSPKATLKV
ncbi:protein BTG1-like [Cotesia glomerata]|uniref:Anti-proliferative protein domain-containing protein n=1 Tax=Cotesia glomerata TaxID=32391 RepID=A0AAV7I5R8_COTGL|nr:protein BTG1-like [Cotesia glomerata]XP_044576451.1 protein BTG1-like [Cotesia glomerata]KAH0540591.1 hypothetical protein KQX54_018438 [Cotesia glomerata]